MKAKNRKPDHKTLVRNRSNLELEKYYEGEQHQIGRHVVVIVSQVLLMIVVSAYIAIVTPYIDISTTFLVAVYDCGQSKGVSGAFI